MKEIIIREIREEEYPIMEDMLYEAIFQEENAEPYPRKIIKKPVIYILIDNFGTLPDDYCLVGEIDNKIVGAVWVRILDTKEKSFGYIDSRTPEFVISLFKDFRNKGYGTLLMQKMIKYLKEKKYEQASLSVDKNNYAVKMYKKLGFKTIRENKYDYLMVLKLNQTINSH